jgi:hypothetical protein
MGKGIEDKLGNSNQGLSPVELTKRAAAEALRRAGEIVGGAVVTAGALSTLALGGKNLADKIPQHSNPDGATGTEIVIDSTTADKMDELDRIRYEGQAKQAAANRRTEEKRSKK